MARLKELWKAKGGAVASPLAGSSTTASKPTRLSLKTPISAARPARSCAGSGAFAPSPYRPRYDKLARILAQSSKFESAQVLLPREAPWLATYLGELMGFPNARHDDQVDSTSQALDWLSQKIGAGLPRERPNPTRRSGLPLRGGTRQGAESAPTRQQ
jgi:hypothetical protein